MTIKTRKHYRMIFGALRSRLNLNFQKFPVLQNADYFPRKQKMK